MSRRLYLTNRSPFARKVSIVLAEKGLPVEFVVVDLAARSPDFVAVSPIGKVPVLVEEDGTAVIDSTVICEYLDDRYPQPTLGGADWRQRLAVRQLDEYGDSLAEQAITVYMGRQAGTPNAKAEGTMARLLATLEERVAADGAPLCGTFTWVAADGAPLCGTFTWADAAVLSALGYASFRLGNGWRDGHPRLAAWFDVMDRRPSAAATRPRE